MSVLLSDKVMLGLTDVWDEQKKWLQTHFHTTKQQILLNTVFSRQSDPVETHI